MQDALNTHTNVASPRAGSLCAQPAGGQVSSAPAIIPSLHGARRPCAPTGCGLDVRYGLALGGYAAVVFGGVDAVAVALSGACVPASLLILIICCYAVMGWVGGALLGGMVGLVARHRSQAGAMDPRRAQVERSIVGTGLVVCGVVLLERFLGRGEEDIGTGLAAISIFAGCGGLALCIVSGMIRPGRASPMTLYTWNVFCISLLLVLWKPFHESYHAAALGLMGVLMNAAYLISAALIYLGGRTVVMRLWRPTAENRQRSFLGWTLPVGALGAAVSLGSLALVTPRPLEAYNHTPAPKLALSGPGRPTVVLIVLDTVRADHLTPYGYPLDTTPNLAEFSKEAVIYSNAIAPSSWTYPSHVSLFTGLMPTEHQAHYDKERDDEGTLVKQLDESYTTLAEVLQSHGYTTGGIVANIVPLRPELGIAQGFDYYDIRPRAALDTAYPGTLSPGLWLTRLFQRFTGRTEEGYAFRDASDINADALQWLDRREEAPVFLFLNYADPHEPYRDHPEYHDRLAWRMHEEEPAPSSAPGWVGHPRIPQEEWGNIALYDGELAHVDHYLGELFRELRRRGLYDESLIIVTSDHGEAFGEHGHTGHLHSVYQEEVWIPLIVRHPGGLVRGREDGYTSLTSVFGMVLDSVGIALDDPRQYRPAPAASPGVLAELYLPLRLRDGSSQWVMRGLYREDGLKTVSSFKVPGEVELYDLLRDPFELDNLASVSVDVCLKMDASVSEWVQAAKAARPETNPAPTMSKELRRQLRSLGYLD